MIPDRLKYLPLLLVEFNGKGEILPPGAERLYVDCAGDLSRFAAEYVHRVGEEQGFLYVVGDKNRRQPHAIGNFAVPALHFAAGDGVEGG